MKKKVEQKNNNGFTIIICLLVFFMLPTMMITPFYATAASKEIKNIDEYIDYGIDDFYLYTGDQKTTTSSKGTYTSYDVRAYGFRTGARMDLTVRVSRFSSSLVEASEQYISMRVFGIEDSNKEHVTLPFLTLDDFIAISNILPIVSIVFSIVYFLIILPSSIWLCKKPSRMNKRVFSSVLILLFLVCSFIIYSWYIPSFVQQIAYMLFIKSNIVFWIIGVIGFGLVSINAVDEIKKKWKKGAIHMIICGVLFHILFSIGALV